MTEKTCEKLSQNIVETGNKSVDLFFEKEGKRFKFSFDKNFGVTITRYHDGEIYDIKPRIQLKDKSKDYFVNNFYSLMNNQNGIKCDLDKIHSILLSYNNKKENIKSDSIKSRENIPYNENLKLKISKVNEYKYEIKFIYGKQSNEYIKIKITSNGNLTIWYDTKMAIEKGHGFRSIPLGNLLEEINNINIGDISKKEFSNKLNDILGETLNKLIDNGKIYNYSGNLNIGNRFIDDFLNIYEKFYETNDDIKVGSVRYINGEFRELDGKKVYAAFDGYISIEFNNGKKGKLGRKYKINIKNKEFKNGVFNIIFKEYKKKGGTYNYSTIPEKSLISVKREDLEKSIIKVLGNINESKDIVNRILEDVNLKLKPKSTKEFLPKIENPTVDQLVKLLFRKEVIVSKKSIPSYEKPIEEKKNDYLKARSLGSLKIGWERFKKNGLQRVYKKCLEHGVPLEIAFLALHESNWDNNLISNRNAKSYWQITPVIEKAYGNIGRPPKFGKSTDVAFTYLKDTYRYYYREINGKSFFEGKDTYSDKHIWLLSMSEYNAGNKVRSKFNKIDMNIDKYYANSLKHKWGKENREYIIKILARMEAIREVTSQGYYQD